ncbi:MAG: hypothetical protein FWE12_04120 [Oscillospiraceae bacterium]|nr:hypothetical protein [Oscillospiraceae bacterium]
MLKRVKARLEGLGLSPPAEDEALLKTLLTGAKRWILAETGQGELPKELRAVVVDRAAGEYLDFRKTIGRLSEFDQEYAVRQMSQGDTSVTYAVEFGQGLPVDVLIESLRTPPEALLARWRRLRW